MTLGLGQQGSMGYFETGPFVEEPKAELEDAGSFRKADWWLIAELYGVEVRRKARKAEIKEAVIKHLRYAGLVQEVASGQEEKGSEDAGRRSEGSVEREISLHELEIRKLDLRL